MSKQLSYTTLLSELENIKNFKDLYYGNKLGNFEKYVESDEFFNFVLNEFEKTIIHATIYDLSTFAFGSLENALSNYFKRIFNIN